MSVYAELRAKSCFSFLRGASQPEELVAAARELGLTALAVTDVASLAGSVRAHKAAKEAALRYCVGAEVEPRDGPPLVLLARDRAGYGRLCRLLTTGRRRAPKGECELRIADVVVQAEGLTAIVVPSRLETSTTTTSRGDSPDLLRLREAFDSRLFLALEWHGDVGDAARVLATVARARKLNVKTVVTNDVHYHTRERAALQDVLTAIRERTTVANAGYRLFPNAERALRSARTQVSIFERILGTPGVKVVERSAEIAEQCQFSMDELRYEYPDEIVPAGETPAGYLRTLTLTGAAERFPRGVPKKVMTLLEHEMALVAELRYEPYFLTVHDIVAFARSKDILCQGRGSAANSAICYCLGVTSVDPSRMELLFERFLSKERNEPPDIDIDFEHERREEVLQYVYNKYGRDRAGIAAEVICYRGRSAVRDVGKALGLSLDQVDRLSKALEHWHRADLTPERLREAGISPDDPNIQNVVKYVSEITDFPRHLSQHVGGFVISRGPLCELVPIENAAMEGRTVVEWDKNDLETLGMLKVDLLALGILTATRKCLDMVRENYCQEYSLATIPSEDPETYEMLCRADAVGVFQVESRAQRAMLPRLRPRRFYDLVVEIAIVRPGPIQGGMVHPYLRRRAGEEPYDIDEYPQLRQVLERTHGVPLFQEQVMKMAVVGAGFTPGEADQLRRAMGAWKKHGEIEVFHGKFVSGMLTGGFPLDFAERVFDQIRGFGEYGFPESHAASFALIAYATAWLKRFYPAAFTAALLNSQPMGFYAPAQLVADAREHGIEVRAVDVNRSSWDCTLELVKGRRARPAQDGALPEHWGKPGPAMRLGFRLVKGLERAAAERIARAREAGGVFTSLENCASRSDLDKRALEALVAADAFASAGAGRRAAMWEALGIDKKPPLFESVEFERFEPELDTISDGEQVVRDYESLGLSLRQHPMWFLRQELDAMGVRAAADVLRFPADTQVRVAGLVVTRQRPTTASGILFVSIEDETGTLNLIVPPRVFERDRLAARAATAIVAIGNVERQGDVVHVKTWKLWEVTQLRRLQTQRHEFH